MTRTPTTSTPGMTPQAPADINAGHLAPADVTLLHIQAKDIAWGSRALPEVVPTSLVDLLAEVGAARYPAVNISTRPSFSKDRAE